MSGEDLLLGTINKVCVSSALGKYVVKMFRIFYQRLVRNPWTNITETLIFIPSVYCLANNTLVQLLAKMLQLQFSFLSFLVFVKKIITILWQ